jgi:hypothetical protein
MTDSVLLNHIGLHIGLGEEGKGDDNRLKTTITLLFHVHINMEGWIEWACPVVQQHVLLIHFSMNRVSCLSNSQCPPIHKASNPCQNALGWYGHGIHMNSLFAIIGECPFLKADCF